MKIIVCILLILISAKECDKKNEALNNASTEQSRLKMAQEELNISYRASTRGFFEVIEIVGDSIAYTNDYNQKKYKTYLIPSEEKEALINLLSQINLDTLKTLEAPSKTHQYDAAPAAFLKVTKGDDVYMTPSFDHGKPPKMINDIIEKILSIKSMFDKQ